VEKWGLSYPFDGDWSCVLLAHVGFFDCLSSPFLVVGGGFCAGVEMSIVVIGVWSICWFLWWGIGWAAGGNKLVVRLL
jgi:hypothetical protein